MVYWVIDRPAGVGRYCTGCVLEFAVELPDRGRVPGSQPTVVKSR